MTQPTGTSPTAAAARARSNAMSMNAGMVPPGALCYQPLSASGTMNGKSQRPKSGERIAKVIARAGLGSRREAEQWIAAGRVAVNGAAIASAALNVTARDAITVDGEPLPTRERTRLFLYNKPRGLVSTRADPQGRPTVFERLPKDLPRLISIGRLDFNTEGLLLLTNDGGLARVLELPDTGWLRRYRVRAHGAVTQAALDALRDGVSVDGIHYGPIEATLDRAQGSNVWLTFAIREGKNREVRNVLGHLGLAVTRLIRVSFGPFQLGELAEGAVEEIKTRVLREQLGNDVISLSGADFSAHLENRELPPTPIPQPQPRPPQRKSHAPGHESHLPHRHPEALGAQRRASKGDGRSDTARTPHRGPDAKHRHPEALVAQRRASKGERRNAAATSFEGRLRRPPQDDEGKRRQGQLKRSSASHAWREHKFDSERDKPLRRKFRGARRDEKFAAEAPAAEKRAGLLTDRKGRRVLVERFASKPAEEPVSDKQHQRPPKRGRRRGADRGSGPRPSRPRPR
jgi:23S rRNA pseudouridine2605 synthase